MPRNEAVISYFSKNPAIYICLEHTLVLTLANGPMQAITDIKGRGSNNYIVTVHCTCMNMQVMSHIFLCYSKLPTA